MSRIVSSIQDENRSYTTKKRSMLWASAIGSVAGLTAFAPTESLMATGAAILIAVVMVMPELGLALSLYAGRFDSFPFRELFPNWFYVTLPLIILTGLGFGLIRARYGKDAQCKGWIFPLAMAFSLLAGLAYTDGVKYGLSKTLEFALYILPLFYLVQLILRDSYERAANLMLFSFLLSGVLAMAGLATGAGPESRIAAFGGGPNVFARLVAFGVMALPAIWQRWSGIVMRVCIAVGILLMSLAVLLSGSRGSFIALILCMLAVVFLWPTKGRGMWKIVLLVIMAALAIFVFVRFMDQFVALARFALLFAEDPGSSINFRVRMITESLRMALRSPVFGRGTGAFPILFSGTDFPYYPHNILVEVFVENGLIGVVILMGFIVFTLRHAFRLWRRGGLSAYEKRVLLSIGACFIFSVAVAQVTGDQYDNRMIWFYGSALLALNERTSARKLL